MCIHNFKMHFDHTHTELGCGWVAYWVVLLGFRLCLPYRLSRSEFSYCTYRSHAIALN